MEVIKLLWENKYSVGIIEVDEQHKMLFRILNQLAEHIKNGITEKILTSNLTHLRDYCLLHFNTEEKIMLKQNPEVISDHIKLHKAFVDKLNKFVFQAHEGNPEKTSIEIYTFVHNWLKGHVLTVDLIHLQKK